ncbi:hypothetical protein M885DRAFT_572175 [Pelagophyceae sp. CCMP2097]|nr:hypothetical protein M885DRAFT_572175 [Pelagophyceae sp. CCMP2097]
MVDVLDTVLSWGGAAAAPRRARRRLLRRRAALRNEAAAWHGSRAGLVAEENAVKSQSAEQQAQLRKWGLKRLTPAFAALAASRLRRAELQRDEATAACRSLETRAKELSDVLEMPAAEQMRAAEALEAPDALLRPCEELQRLRQLLRDVEAAIEAQVQAVRALRPAVAPRPRSVRATLLRGCAENFQRLDAAASSNWAAAVRTDCSEDGATDTDTCSNDDVFDEVSDEREREGRLLARWRERSLGAQPAPRAVIAFANYFGDTIADAYALEAPLRPALRSLALSLAVRSLNVISPPTQAKLDVADLGWRQDVRRLSAAVVSDVAGLPADLHGSTFPECGKHLARLDDEDAAPSDLLRTLFDAFRELHAEAHEALEANAVECRALAADDVLPALVCALLGDCFVEALDAGDAPESNACVVSAPHRALHLIRAFALHDATLSEGRGEATYFATTLDAALEHVKRFATGDSPAAADLPPPPRRGEDYPDAVGDFDATAFDVLAVEADEEASARRSADERALCDLGSFIGKNAEMEDALDLLRNEGWMA